MRRFFKIWPGPTSSEGSGFQLLLAADELSATGPPFWVGLPPKREFVDQFNSNIEGGGFSGPQMLASLRIVTWSEAGAFHNNPDFSGYWSWEKMRDGR